MESLSLFFFLSSFFCLTFLQIFYMTLEKLDGDDSALEVNGPYSTKR